MSDVRFIKQSIKDVRCPLYKYGIILWLCLKATYDITGIIRNLIFMKRCDYRLPLCFKWNIRFDRLWPNMLLYQHFHSYNLNLLVWYRWAQSA